MQVGTHRGTLVHGREVDRCGERLEPLVGEVNQTAARQEIVRSIRFRAAV